ADITTFRGIPSLQPAPLLNFSVRETGTSPWSRGPAVQAGPHPRGGFVMGRLIRQGCKGADVRAVQDVLNFHIRRLQPLDVDGDFGPKPHARVVEFQKANKLKVDGLVGPETLGKLFEEELVPVSLALVPQLTLTMPPFGQRPRGLQPPQLI